MIESEIEAVADVIREAGKALLGFYAGSGEGDKFQVYRKPDGSPVTDADLASDKIIRSRLGKLFPSDVIATEETPAEAMERLPEYAWIVDPLDGTNSFINGVPDFCVLAARCRNGIPIYGAMYFPALELFAWGAEGRGAFLNGTKLSVSNSPSIKPAGLYHRGFEPKDKSLSFPQKLHSGPAFLSLCEGKLDGVILDASRFGEHDYAAPAIILEEAGGKVTDELGEPLKFSLGKPKIRFLLASNRKAHEELLQIFRR